MSRKEQQGTHSYVKYGTKYQSILAYLGDLQLVASPAYYFLNLDEIKKKAFQKRCPCKHTVCFDIIRTHKETKRLAVIYTVIVLFL